MPDFKKRPPTEEGSNSPAVRPQDELRRNYRDAKAKSGATPQPLPPFSKSKWSELLTAYFYSGWAFLIPYLATYLLYAWLKWPVNPQIHNENTARGTGSSWVPCLLHLYWALHAAHVFLGIAALKIWWQKNENHPADNPAADTDGSPTLNRLWPILPWLLLALIFWIPGVYLEWPSDPWEHLRRINEWRVLDLVTTHSSWMKSSYFIPYSMLSWTDGLRQLFWLDFYHTGICLLLCWQYYRLARVCDLGKLASIVFVISQALLLGNSIFSFYRYYSISSSIYAQIGAVALTHLTLEWAGSYGSLAESKTRFIGQHFGHGTMAVLCLLLLTAFNHLQGLGIAALGIAAIVIWRVIKWKISALGWIAALTLAANLLFLRLYSRPALIEDYRADGILNAWYGFNILKVSSPAGDRMLQIVNVIGVINLGAAFLLVIRNRVVAWLTIIPLATLLLPLAAIPLAQVLAAHGDPSNVVTFQRMLFAVPPSLALVLFIAEKMDGRDFGSEDAKAHPRIRATFSDADETHLKKSIPPFYFASGFLFMLIVFASSHPYFNRVWNSLSIIPNDLQMRDVILRYESLRPQLIDHPELKVVATQAGGALLSCYSRDLVGPSQSRTIGLPALDSVKTALEFLNYYKSNFCERPANLPSEIPVGQNLIIDSNAADPSAWLALGSLPRPEFVSDIRVSPSISTALQNPVGVASWVFTSAMIAVDSTKSYRLEMTVRQFQSTDATVFLAISWFDANRIFLASDTPSPRGAGNPRGWINGTYSYFGLISQKPSKSWKKYGISFGFGDDAAIPSEARYVRIGALLNYNASSSGKVQITAFQLEEKKIRKFGLAIPSETSPYSSKSQAALLSGHWPPQQVMADRGGTKEIQTTAAALKSFSCEITSDGASTIFHN